MCAPSTRSTRSTSKLFTKVMAAEGNCRKEVKVMNEQPLRRDAFVLLKKNPHNILLAPSMHCHQTGGEVPMRPRLGPLRVQQPLCEVLLRPEVNVRGEELQTTLRHDRPGNALRSPPRQRGHDLLAPILLNVLKARRHFAPCFPKCSFSRPSGDVLVKTITVQ